MYFDYFLIHRAHQIHRLRTSSEGNRIELPGSHARGAYPRELTKLFRSIDKICELSEGKESETGMLARFASMLSGRSRSDEGEIESEQGGLLTDSQREMLLEFERDIVRLRQSDERDSVHLASRIIGAILADHEFFNGLRPLAYAESFGYEFLFPSWLNLFTVLNQREEGSREARFSEQQQRTIFSYLEQWKDEDNNTEADLVAALTFTANRFTAPACFDLVQRMVDRTYDNKSKRTTDRMRLFWKLRASIENAIELQRHLEDYLVIQSSVYRPTTGKELAIADVKATRFALPTPVIERLKSLGGESGGGEQFLALIGPLRAMYQQAGGISPNMAGLLSEHPDQMLDILLLSVARERSFKSLSRGEQQIVAKVAQLEVDEGRVHIERVKPFASNIAMRTDGFSEGASRLFVAEFIQKESNRRAILGACATPAKLRRISTQVLKMALKAKAAAKFFQYLSIAVVLDTEIDLSRLEEIQMSLLVLQAIHDERSIGHNESEDLLSDMRSNIEDALTALERPILAASGKSDRLAKLYLALHEARETYRHTGRTANFSISRAGFSNLGKLIDGLGIDE